MGSSAPATLLYVSCLPGCEAQVPGAPLLQNACACRWAIAGQQGQGGQGETERVHPACRLASC